ncbi:KH domain-containing protein [Zea mays]|uniref:KH domain-containing protein n=1 Tax=Zea mays TaxID=4577 RepID=A0A3L6F3J6_MAIZE|nr:KH domain-containing protein [Zea mays]
MRQQTGKRPRQHREYEREEKKDQHKRPFPNAHESSNNDGLVLYRILCPDSLIGSVIGKNGNVINAIRQQTSAKVMVVDPYPGADKRVILVYCYVKHRDLDAVGNDNEPVCAAQDALLRVHNAIVDALHKVHKNRRDSDNKDTEEANILVPASQTSNIIGKSGAVIKHLRSTSRAFVKVTPKDPSDATHSCAMSFDNFVQITGGAEAVKKALFGVSTIIYKHPSKEGIPLETSIPEPTPSIIIPSELPVYPASNFYSAPDDAIPSVHPSLSILGSTRHLSELDLPANDHGELEFRVLCPGDKIGLVIGRGGATIKNIRQESGARIDVDDAKNGKEESIITITSTEVINDVKSAAVEAVLLLQAKINDYEDDRMNLRLVPNKVIGCLIGRAGSIVNDMRKKTKANILISKGNKPWRASSSDELVEVSGEADKLRDALVQIILRLREDVLKESVESQNSDKDGKLTTAISDSLYGNNLSFPALLPQNPQIVSLGYDRRGESERALEVFPCTSSYGYSSMKDHVTDDGYGGLPSYTSKAYEEHLPRVEMTVPASGLSKVMGKHGTNLENIRKISGAHIEIIESKSSRHEHVAYITGTSEQRQSAENLIKAFIMST